MKLPNGEHAIVDIEKVRDYCLNPDHLDGKDKARVFRSALGLTQKDAQALRECLLVAAREGDVLAGPVDEFGARFSLDFELTWRSRRAVVRSGWIVLAGARVPRLTTCYVR
jgi:hypothetical protein